MDRLAPTEPRVLVGDLNVWEEGGPVCNQTPVPSAMQILRDAGNLDGWPSVHGTAEGYTGMWNRNGCGDPNGYLWKRIDQAWSKALPAPVSMIRFGMVTPGACAPSDHAGIIVAYPWPGADTTAPTVALTTPAKGAIVSGATLIAASAVDHVGVTRVGFTVDGASLVEFTSAPYEFRWDTSTVANGARTIGAWAQDAAGNRGYAESITVWVDNPPPPNSPPLASFSSTCVNLDCAFTDTSTDAEGPIAAWAWTFGDGTTSVAQHPTRTYAAGGTYTVSLRVTDSRGATSTATQSVTVAAPAAGPFDFSLSASPNSRSVNAPGRTSYTVSSTLISGTATAVTLSVSGLPAGTTATFDASSISTPGSTTLRINTSKGTPAGTSLLTVSGTGGGVTRTVQVSLVVVHRR
ncbi:MAG: PKD domain-containing protein [Acidobacteria bacterium]|nr:PKD domain-containing protein [Acidobacteriota bacterium]MBA3887751.1 PKD domain-containing protein [Acidobacteriota bacterium]